MKTLPQLHQSKSVACMTGEKWHSALTRLRTEIDNGAIVAIIGPQGTGKTQLAVEAARGRRGTLYRTFKEVSEELRATYGKSVTKTDSDVTRTYGDAGLLILDDCHHRPPSDFERSALHGIVDSRYRNRRAMVMIYAGTFQGFADFAGADVLRRVNESGGVLLADWQPIPPDAIAKPQAPTRAVADGMNPPRDFERFFRAAYLNWLYEPGDPIHAKYTAQTIAGKWWDRSYREDYAKWLAGELTIRPPLTEGNATKAAPIPNSSPSMRGASNVGELIPEIIAI